MTEPGLSDTKLNITILLQSQSILHQSGMANAQGKNVRKFRTPFSICCQINVGYQGQNSQTACQKGKQGRP